MSERRTRTTGALPPKGIGRRDFFRGAAALTVGSFGATTGFAQTTPPSELATRADATRELDEQTSRALRWAGRDPADWVRARNGLDHNVVIVGGGQSGLSIAYGLKRKGVGRVAIIDKTGSVVIFRKTGQIKQDEWKQILTQNKSGERSSPVSHVTLKPTGQSSSGSYCPNCQNHQF